MEMRLDRDGANKRLHGREGQAATPHHLERLIAGALEWFPADGSVADLW
jgi:hypothetical protein